MSWLYTEPDLRDAITGLRRRPDTSTAPPPTAQRATTDSLLERLDNARDEITRLRAENNTLHARLARSLGEQRTPLNLHRRHVHHTARQVSGSFRRGTIHLTVCPA